MPDFVTCTCPSCGAKLRITVEPSASGVSPVPVPSAAKPSGEPEKEKMDAALEVELGGIQIVPADTRAWRLQTEAHFTFRYRNKGPVGIRAFTGTAIFSDLFDRPQKKLGTTCDTPIDAGAEVVHTSLMYQLNQFDNQDTWMATTPMENMHFTYEIKSIIFANGTKLGSAD